MSRIHEALKRAEQEKAAGQPIGAGDAAVEHAVKSTVVETAPPPAKVSPKSAFPALNTTHLTAEPVPNSVRFDELWAKCQKKEWRPDPNVIVFGTASPFVPGAEQFRTLRSRLYRMRESQPLQTILISSAIPAEGKTVVSSNLAFALVRQQGSRVLLIDADLRSPRVHM